MQECEPTADENGRLAKDNRLYYGDNLDVLRRYVRDETVDLIYLDPPFNSRREYNVIFKERSGAAAASQQQAFLDSWDWPQAADTYAEVLRDGGKVAEALQALHVFIGPSDMLAYLAMMAPRLIELRRVLKPTGSIYLHCDPTASHYLKLLMDAVFGPQSFRNEIVWKRTGSHNSARRFGPVHDVLLYYVKTDLATWNQQHQQYDSGYQAKFSKIDPATGQQFQDVTLTGPGVRTGPSGQAWRGFDPSKKGRHWQPASYVYTKYKAITGEELNQYPLLTRLDRLDAVGLIFWPKKKGGQPRYKQFWADTPGAPLLDVWTDIDAVNSQAQERIGYPTQKPEALLARIIAASSNASDLVLDPFCGCGTTIAAAHKLGRRWIGIDVTARAIDIIVDRLRNDYGAEIDGTYETSQYPYSVADALRLAKDNGFHFQRWALERLGVNPSDIKPGADRGIDGKLYFADGDSGRTKRIVLSVKGGQRVGPSAVRDLRGVLDRDGFSIGVLVTAEPPTDAAVAELVSGRRHYEAADGRRYHRLQCLTVEDIFAGKGVKYPGATEIERLAKPVKTELKFETLELDFESEPEPRVTRLGRVSKPTAAKAKLDQAAPAARRKAR